MKIASSITLALALALTACEGPEGPEGPAGPTGPQGEAGDDGTNGSNGGNGTDGADGQDGVDGVDGEDGVPLTLTFEGAPFPKTDAQKRDVLASPKAWVDGEEVDLDYHVLARSGDKLVSGTFGALVDEDGNIITEEDGSEVISSSMDFNSLLEVDGKLFSVTHFESRPGAMYVSEVQQDETTGDLSFISTKPIDFGDDGLWVPCAGSVTPWGTHLGGEEYPTDAWAWREWEATNDPSSIDGYTQPMLRYWGLDADTNTWSEVAARFNVFEHGFPIEVAVDSAGNPTVTRHYAMGRVAVELAYVMPDQKTAYITDDGTNVGLYMFIADKAGDLSAGTLYAAKWIQTSSVGAGSADLDWIELGKVNNDQVRTIIDLGEGFDDWWDYEFRDESGDCPSGYTSVNDAGYPYAPTPRPTCLKVKPGKERAAAYLDTRRYAAYLGATTEWRKMEGITYDPTTGRAFIAMSELEYGMESYAKNGSGDGRYDLGGPDDIRLDTDNQCGAVYALDIRPDPGFGSDYIAANMYGYVVGTPVAYPDGSPYAGNRCSINGIANPDNVTVIPGYDQLIIGEDTGSGHQNDAVWAWDMKYDHITRIQTTPYGSETTSPYWYPEIGSHAYLMSVVQHPYGESDRDKAVNPEDFNGYVGYIGNFPAMPWQ